MKQLFLLLAAVLLPLSMAAQFFNTGKVIDKQGLPLSGATVRGKGLMSSTTTNMDGSFSLETTLPIRQIEATYMGKKKVAQRTDYTIIVIDGRGGSGDDSNSSEGHPWFFNAQGGFHSGPSMGSFGAMMGYASNWGGYFNAMYDGEKSYVATAGIIKKVYNGFNIFIGGGVGSDESAWTSGIGFVGDAGILLRLSRFNINAGIAFNEESYARLGIGYSF